MNADLATLLALQSGMNEMDWLFRIVTIAMTVGVAVLVPSAISRMIFDALDGAGFVRLPLAALPLTMGLYASIHVIISCLFDDRDDYPLHSSAD